MVNAKLIHSQKHTNHDQVFTTHCDAHAGRAFRFKKNGKRTRIKRNQEKHASHTHDDICRNYHIDGYAVGIR